jgi:hypothetical protein
MLALFTLNVCVKFTNKFKFNYYSLKFVKNCKSEIYKKKRKCGCPLLGQIHTPDPFYTAKPTLSASPVATCAFSPVLGHRRAGPIASFSSCARAGTDRGSPVSVPSPSPVFSVTNPVSCWSQQTPLDPR